MVQAGFSFEDLKVWQKSVEFAKAILNITEKIQVTRKHYRLIEQLESASTSVALNIAEGKGRYSRKEFIHFLYVARGSLYETVALLIIFYRNDWLNEKQLINLKTLSSELGKMLSGLINALKLQTNELRAMS